jgi:hypothetical protein
MPGASSPADPPWEPIPPRQSEPSLARQRNEVNAAEEGHALRAGETGFVVSAPWLQSWRDYVGAGAASPGPIDNRHLCSQGSFDWHSMREADDYVILPRAVWDLLFGWFGGGPDIRVPMTSSDRGPVPNFLATRLTSTFVFQHKDAAQAIETPRERLIGDLKCYVMEQFDVDTNGQYRLVDFFRDKFHCVFDDGKTLCDYTVYEGQKIVLDYMEDGEWIAGVQPPPPPEPLSKEKQEQLRVLRSMMSGP